MKPENTEISKPGFNFSGKPLTEDNLHCDVDVFYEGETYKTGNRGHMMVELFRGKFIMTVRISEVSLIRSCDTPTPNTMNTERKTVEEIKDIVARQFGFNSWDEAYNADEVSNIMIDECMEAYKNPPQEQGEGKAFDHELRERIEKTAGGNVYILLNSLKNIMKQRQECARMILTIPKGETYENVIEMHHHLNIVLMKALSLPLPPQPGE